jgi:prephenate dehydrogenase
MNDAGRRPPFRSAGVIGLGLVGGSVARDLAALGVRVLAYDRDPASIEMARAEGVVDEALDASLAGLEEAEVVVIAVPVSSLSDVLMGIPRLPDARLITDVGSTKRSAMATAEAIGIADRFVGSHPMAGDHRSGWKASRTGLFARARVYLCRAQETREDVVRLAHDLWSALGGCPELIAADMHDELLAYTSHLPHAASAALALTLAGAGIDRAKLGPGGRDSTRLAGGSVEMWSAIARDNADALLPAIAALEAQLQNLRAELARENEGAIRDALSTANAWTNRS